MGAINLMPKLIIEVTNDKVANVIDALVKAGTKFTYIPDNQRMEERIVTSFKSQGINPYLTETKPVVINKREPAKTQSEMSNAELAKKGLVKSTEEVIKQFLFDNQIATQAQLIKHIAIELPNIKKQSVYSKISYLFTTGKVTKQIIDKVAWYSLK